MCITNASTNKYALRAVDLYNGGVQIICPYDPDEPGDININGIAYEVADAVMFSNYFVSGLLAFEGHVDGSIAASDVTRDGKTLTIADLVFLIDVIVGDAQPYSQLTPSPNVATFTWNVGSGVVDLSTLDTLGAVYLVVSGNVVPSLHASQMEMKCQTDNVVTRILIWSLEGAKIVSGDLLSISGATGIVSIETATYDARAVTTKIDIPGSQKVPYEVRIGIKDSVVQGDYVDLPITLERFDKTQGLAGFNLLLGYDASALAFQLASEGDLYDSCAWEYFTYRFNPDTSCGPTCPSGMIRIVGLAETNNGDYHPNPSCALNGRGWVSSVPVTLANLRFLVSSDVELAGQWVPIRFFWTGCGDNALSNFDGSQTYVSSLVYDYYGPVISQEGSFPTYRGAQPECVFDNSCPGRSSTRWVDFYNGALELNGRDTIDCRRDINKTASPTKSPMLRFATNYLLNVYSGPGTTDTLQCADINMDGQNTIADIVYLLPN